MTTTTLRVESPRLRRQATAGPCPPGGSRPRRSAGHEVLGLGMVADDRRGGLLGLGLEARVLVALQANPLTLQQVQYLLVVLEVRAGGVAPRVAPAAVLLAEQAGERGPVLVGEPPLLPHAPVPVLGEGLGHLDPEAVEQEVLLVPVVGEQLGRALRHRRAHGDDRE